MKAILIAFLLLLIALACTLANPPADIEEFDATIDLTMKSEIETALARPTLSDEEIRKTQFAVVETATAIAPYIPLTHEAWRSTITTADGTLQALGGDAFSLTGTSLVVTATALASRTHVSPTPSRTPSAHTQWPVIEFRYDEVRENWMHNPRILNSSYYLDVCIGCETRFPPSHHIMIYSGQVLDEAMLYVILEDAISRLPAYPPFNPEVYEKVLIEDITLGYVDYGRFSYSEAIAAYTSGLRGEDLSEALEFE